MKQKKLIIGILAILVLLTAVLALIHFNTRAQVPEGALMVNYQGKSAYIELNKLTMAEVSGTVVNGKGEEKQINEQGVGIADVLQAAGIDPAAVGGVTVTAADEFSAELSAEEVTDTGKAFLVEDGEGSVKLIVFGDSNAKRNVRDVVKLDVR